MPSIISSKIELSKEMESIVIDELNIAMSANYCTMLTPCKGDNPLPMDEDSGSWIVTTLRQKIPARRCVSIDSRTRLGPMKRLAECHGDDRSAPTNKRRRHSLYNRELFEDPETTLEHSPMSSIISALNRLTTASDVTDDGSSATRLPTIPGKQGDLNCVSPYTVRDVLSGYYDDEVDTITIIDCRYHYEYKGGHIKNAINLYTKDAIREFLQDSRNSSTSRRVLIFHCEFSSKRGPKMCRFLRSEDRRLNEDRYPGLHFPDVYLLEGGYKALFQSHQALCYRQAYMPMLHKEHKVDLRHFRVKSKSWAAGDRTERMSRGTGVRLSF